MKPWTKTPHNIISELSDASEVFWTPSDIDMLLLGFIEKHGQQEEFTKYIGEAVNRQNDWRLDLHPGDEVIISGNLITICEIKYYPDKTVNIPDKTVKIVAASGEKFDVYLNQIS
jgi:hypothetical protein